MGVIALYIKSSVLHILGNLKLLLYFRRGEMPGMNNPKRRRQTYSETADLRNLVSRKTARGWCPRDGHTQALGGSWHAQNISQASKNKHRGKYFGVRVWNYYLNEVTTSQQLDGISKGNNAEDESRVCCSICCSEKLFSVWHSFCSDRKYRLRQLFYTLFFIWLLFGRGNYVRCVPKITQLQHKALMFADSRQDNPKGRIVGLTASRMQDKNLGGNVL